MLDHSANEQQLVDRARHGDQAAFNALVTKYHARLLNVVCRIVHDRDDAKDIVQIALLNAYRALPAFRGDAAFFSWLQAIATNTAKTMLQRRKRAFSTHYAFTDVDDDGQTRAHERADPATPENLLECRQVAGVVAKAMTQMRIELTLAITLHEAHGLSYEQIAHVMYTPIGTVRRRIHDARQHIAQRIASATSLPLSGAPRA
jgi:RNA polymerase sigma-70 factor (ECF subfamily)